MCCGVTVKSLQGHELKALAIALWGKPTSEIRFQSNWVNPLREASVGRVLIKMQGKGHDVSPESWLEVVKYAVGFYAEAVRQGLSPYLSQLGEPCLERVIAYGELPVDMTRFCRAALGAMP